jgi:hypothetical protein
LPWATRLEHIPEDIAAKIRRILVHLLGSLQFRTKYIATRAHIARLNNPEKFFSILRLLNWIRLCHFALSYCFATILTVMCFSKLSHVYTVSASISISIYVFIVLLLLPLSGFVQAQSDEAKVYHTIILYLGSGMIMILVLLFTRGEKLVAFSYIYSQIWTFAAVSAAKNGQFTHPLFWPLLPTFVILSEIKRITSWVASNRKKFLFVLLVFVLNMLLGIVFFSIVGLLLFTATAAFPVTRHHPGLFSLMVYLITSLWMSPTLIKRTRKSLRKHSNDRAILKQFTNQQRYKITGSAFFELLIQYQTNKYRLRFVKHIRKENLIYPSRDTERMLRNLALLIEKEPMWTYTGNALKTYQEELETSAVHRGDLIIQFIPSCFTKVARYFKEIAMICEATWNKLNNYAMNPSTDGEEETHYYSANDADLLDELSLLLENVKANYDDSSA